jgi:hypothetical protein
MAGQPLAEEVMAPAQAVASADVPLSLLRAHKMLGHPVRYKMMLILRSRLASPTELVDEIGEFGWCLKRTCDTVRELRDAGLVERVGRKAGPKGGMRLLYRAVPPRVRLDETGHLVVLPGVSADG